MSVAARIHDKLVEAFTPSHLDVINESHMHNVPPGSESHFKVIVVSEQFGGESRVKRQQAVNTVLADELAGPVHALSMQTLTTPEWEAKGGVIPPSPPCMGGMKSTSA